MKLLQRSVRYNLKHSKMRKRQTLTTLKHLLILLMISHQMSQPMSPHLQEQKKKQKSKKRKRENGENIREVMKSMEESFEKKWFEREEMRRKYEEEREKRIMEKEQEHEARMMSMFMQCVQQVLGHGSWTSTSIPAPHHQYASEPYHPLQNHGHTQIPTGHDQVPTSSGYSNYSLPPPTQ